MTIQAIQEAIQQLPSPERRSLAAWLDELEQREWDEEMERDFAPGGRGALLFAGAEKEEDGDVPLEEFLEQVTTRSKILSL